MSDCKSYVSEEDIKALKESELHIEHVARSRNLAGEKVLSVTDTIRGEKVTNRTLDGLEELYQSALSNIGYQQMGDYKPGITIEGRNQIVFENGSWYIYRGDIPHVTTGATLTEDGGIWSEENPDGMWVLVYNKNIEIDLAKMNDRMQNIYVTDFINSTNSFSDAVQLAIDNAGGADLPSAATTVVLPRGRHVATKRIFIHEKDGLTIKGYGDGATIIEIKSELTNSEPDDIKLLNGKYKNYSYDSSVANALFVITARRSTQTVGYERYHGAAWRLKLTEYSVECSGEAFKKVHNIYAPEFGMGEISNITCSGVISNIKTAVIYSTEYNCINVMNSVEPITHGIGNVGEGTSFHVNRCNATKTEFGWKMKNLFYSSWSNIGCDAWADGNMSEELKHYAYDFDNCQLELNGCGCESSKGVAFGVLKITGGSSIDLNNCTFIGGQYSATSVTHQSLIDGNGTTVNFNNSMLSQGARTHSKIKVSNGAIVNISSAYRQNQEIAGFVKLTDFDTDNMSTVNLYGFKSVITSLSRKTKLLNTVGNLKISFDDIVINSLGDIKSESSDLIPISYSGNYEISLSVSTSGSKTNFYLLLNNSIVQASNEPSNNIVLNKILKLNKGDSISVKYGDLTSSITILEGSCLTVRKI